MTTLTLLTLVVVAYGVLGSAGYGRALALGGATPAGAAVVAGSIAVPTFYTVALGTVGALVLRLLGNGRAPSGVRHRFPPGVTLLVLFTAWSSFVTVVAPVVFNGTAVLKSTGGRGQLVAGTLTSSNIAQVVYLLLGVCVVVFVARSPNAGPELIGIAAGLTTLLSLWRYFNQIAGLPFPEGLFDNSPTFAYIETEIGGAPRFRGIVSEPAGLGLSCLVTISYMLPRSRRLRGWRRAGALFVAAVAAYLGTISTSATFVVAGCVVALVAAVAFGFGFLLRRASVSALVSVTGCAMVVAALFLLPLIADFVAATVDDKVASSSYDDRSNSDTVSYQIFLNTYGLGAGLGASRASSFLPGVLSTTGLVGALLLTAAVTGLIRRGAAVPQYRPVVWALVASLVVKVIAGSDLSDSSGIFWMSLGLLSGAVLKSGVRPGAPPPPDGVDDFLPVPDRRSAS